MESGRLHHDLLAGIAPAADALLHHLLEEMSDPVAVIRTDVDPPMVVAASAAQERLLGRSIVGRPLGADLPREVRLYLRQVARQAAAEGPRQTVGQWRSGGDERSIGATWTPLASDDGQFVIGHTIDATGTVAIGTDTSVLETLLWAAATERRRVAQNLHDDTVQVLSALTMELELLRRRITGAQAEQVAMVRDQLTDANVRIRAMVADLDPAVSAATGVAVAIAARLEAAAASAGTEIRLDDQILDRLPEDVTEALYWIGVEASLNAIRHAEADAVFVSLAPCIGGISLIVRDDGGGFDPHGPAEAGHYGLVSMRARAQRLGGSVAIASSASAGTTVTVWIPLDDDRPTTGSTSAVLPDVDRVAAAIRRLDADHQLAWAALPVGVVLGDRQGRLTRVNPAAAALIGHEADRLEGAVFASLLAPDERTGFELDLADITEGRAPDRRGRALAVGADGAHHDVQYRLRRLDEPAGPPWAWLMALDATPAAS